MEHDPIKEIALESGFQSLVGFKINWNLAIMRSPFSKSVSIPSRV
ncbi:hypothetical protein BFG60_3050 [Microcystis aeruginosa NIES-98]|nr:hypothetical protein BFG60_3050 [Microcystis aeruginosa NIES-98]